MSTFSDRACETEVLNYGFPIKKLSSNSRNSNEFQNLFASVLSSSVFHEVYFILQHDYTF